MRILIYVGPAPSRELVLQICKPIVRQVATSLTLVTSACPSERELLYDALRRLAPPAGMEVAQRTLADTAQAAILAASREHAYDLVIFGRLQSTASRLMPESQSKATAQRLEPAVLRVHGSARPLRRVLVASGGDDHTFEDIAIAARLARPLGASVTLLHVMSPHSQLVSSFPQLFADALEEARTSEARVIRDAAQWLSGQGVPTQVKGRVGLVIDEIMAELRVGSYDLLVIGAHRAVSALDQIMLEDVTGDLLDISPLPVLLVK